VHLGRGDAGAAVVLVDRDASPAPADAAPALPTVDEREPNDTLPQAQPLEPGRAVRGFMHASQAKRGDVDLYRLTLPVAAAPGAPGAPPVPPPTPRFAPFPGLARGLGSQPASQPAPRPAQVDRTLVAVQLTGVPGVDLVLEVLDGNGELLLGVNDGKAGAGESIPNLGLAAGTYYVRVRQLGKKPVADETHPYLLTVTAGPLGPGEEIEPNDKPAWATELLPGAEVTGFLGWRKDEDWYRVPLTASPEAGTLRVDYQGVAGVAASVTVVDSIQTKIAEAKGGRGERVALRNVALKQGEPAVFVVLRSLGGRSAELRYSLRVAIDLPGEPTEIEPNDDRAHATPLAGAGGALAGYLAAPGDVDWFRLTSDAPVLARVEVTCPERVDLKLAVHDQNGVELGRVDEGGRREPEVLVNVPVKGTVFVRVYGRPGDANPDEPYRLTWKLEPDDGTVEHEPNNTPAQANPLPPAGVVQGTIYPRGDADLFRLNAPPDRAATLRATIGPIPKVRLTATLYEAPESGGLGAPVAEAKGPAEGDRVLVAPLQPGKSYLIQVRDASGKVANPRDSYSLRVVLE
jgi:hypothetical protein